MPISFELLDCIRFWGKYHPNAIAVSANGIHWSYAELLTQVNRARSALGQVQPGGRIAVLAHEKRDTTLGVITSLMMGCSAVVLNPNLAPTYLLACIEDARPQAFLVSLGDSQTLEALQRTASLVAESPSVILPVTEKHPVNGPYSCPEPHAEQEWAILYSSGSTGTPKGIERDFESMQTELIGWCLELNLSKTSLFYVGRPVFYTGGLVLTLATLLTGGTVILNELGDPTGETLAADIRSAAASRTLDWVFLVPDQVRLLLAKEVTNAIRGMVEHVLVMGAPIAGREKRELADRLDCVVIESWGNSESLGTITDRDMLHDAPDSIGRPFLGDSMCIVDDSGNQCAPNVIGHLAGGEAAGFTRYTQRPEETAKAKRGGLIVSEDLGWMDSAGRFYIAGRLQERVQVRGQILFLPAMEEAIRDAGFKAPFCLATREYNERVEVGLLVESNEFTPEEVRRVVGTDTLGFDVDRIATTAALPRTASGKIDRTAAESLLWPISS